MLELWLIRHGETIWNKERRMQGQQDSALSELGLQQARLLSKRLASETFTQVHASDSLRAKRTAEIALPDATIMLDARLREMSYGILEGKTEAEFTAEEREHYAGYRTNPGGTRIPQGENWPDILTRVKAWMQDLPADGKIAAFCHGGTVRAALLAVVGAPDKREWDVRIENTSISRFLLSPQKTMILSINDTYHLQTPVTPGMPAA